MFDQKKHDPVSEDLHLHIEDTLLVRVVGALYIGHMTERPFNVDPNRQGHEETHPRRKIINRITGSDITNISLIHMIIRERGRSQKTINKGDISPQAQIPRMSDRMRGVKK